MSEGADKVDAFASQADAVWAEGGAFSTNYRANGVVVGYWDQGLSELTLLDGTRCKSTPAVKLRRWLEKHPEAAAKPARWVVYPRPVKDGTLEFFVVCQRNPLPGESESKVNREIDRFFFSGGGMNVRALKQKLVLRIGRNAPPPPSRKARRSPAWRTRTFFLHGTAGVPQSVVGKQVTVTCRREGTRLVPFHWKLNKAFVPRQIPVGPVLLPWPWRPSSQSIWRLFTKDWPLAPAELTGEASSDLGLLAHTFEQITALHGVLEVELAAKRIRKFTFATSSLGKVDEDGVVLPGTADPHPTPLPEAQQAGMREKELHLLQDEHRRLRQWGERLQTFLETLPPSEQAGLLNRTGLIPRLVALQDALEAQVIVRPTDSGPHLFLSADPPIPIRGAPRTKLLRLLCLTPTTEPTPEPMPDSKPDRQPERELPTEAQVVAFSQRVHAIAERFDLGAAWVRMRIAQFIAGERLD